MPFVNNNGVRIHYQTEGVGPPLVLHHWSLSTLHGWYDYGYVSALRNDYQLILVDARGHGASDKPHQKEAYSLQDRVTDIITILDDIGIARTHFMGYSMGGWIGFGAARYAPERFHSLIIGGQHPYAQSMEGLRQLIRYGIEHGPGAFVTMWEENFGSLDTEEKKRMLGYDFEAQYLAAQDRESLEDFLPTMKIPCLLYVGEEDEIFPLVEQCFDLIENATLVAFKDLDHGNVIERSDAVVRSVKEFLSNVNKQVNESS